MWLHRENEYEWKYIGIWLDMLPKEFVDNISGIIRGICDSLNVSYDKFIRTTDDYHEKQVQKIFKKL